MYKTCSHCGETKELSLFYKNDRYAMGVQGICKACSREYNIKYRAEHPEKCKGRKQKYKKRTTPLTEKEREYNKFKCKRWKQNNKEHVAAYNKMVRSKEWCESHNRRNYSYPEYSETWRRENKEKIKEGRRDWERRKMASDSSYIIKKRLSTGIYATIRGDSSKYEQELGYTHGELLSALGRAPNCDEHIDHKIPLSWFVDTTPICISWSMVNLHIIPARQNRAKNNRFAHPISSEYYSLVLPYLKPKYVDYQFIIDCP
jgi:hypothetical protein